MDLTEDADGNAAFLFWASGSGGADCSDPTTITEGFEGCCDWPVEQQERAAGPSDVRGPRENGQSLFARRRGTRIAGIGARASGDGDADGDQEPDDRVRVSHQKMCTGVPGEARRATTLRSSRPTRMHPCVMLRPRGRSYSVPWIM